MSVFPDQNPPSIPLPHPAISPPSNLAGETFPASCAAAILLDRIPPALIKQVADAEILCFDVDDTINRGRGTAISEEAAELIFQFILAGKKIRVISGRTFDEFREIGTLDPLIRRLKERNARCDLVVYSAEGGEKVAIENDGSFKHDLCYNNPFTEWEARRIRRAIAAVDDRINREQGLRAAGIERYVKNYRNIKYNWSPYGKLKENEAEYKFESQPGGGMIYDPPRKTRDELGEEIVASLRAEGITEIEARVSGKTTVSFTRSGISKRKAMLDVIAEGSAVYFGDEVSRGNDRIIGEMAEEYGGQLTVVALDSPESKVPEGVCHVSGFLEGTLAVLGRAYELCATNAQGTSQKIREIRSVLDNYDIGTIRDITRLAAGHGIHDPFFVISTDRGRFVLRHVRNDLFENAAEAARHEVWMVNTLRENGVPFAGLIPTTIPLGPAKEDRYICPGPNDLLHLLYEYVEGEVGSYRNMNEARLGNMTAMLAKMHNTLAGKKSPYQRSYRASSILSVAAYAGDIESLKESLERKKQEQPDYAYTRSERLVLENADFIRDQLALATRNLEGVYAKLPRLPVHADFHPPNVIFNGDDIAGLIDLEHMRIECRLYDLTPMIRMGMENGRFDIGSAARLIHAYHERSRLKPAEVHALPEIFRLKLLDRVSRLVNHGRHYESIDFDFRDVKEEERSLVLIDRNDKLFLWYQNLLLSLRDLDARVTYGDFKRQIQNPLYQREGTARQVIADCVDDLRGGDLRHSMEVRALESFSLENILGRARSIEDVFREDKGRWSKVGNSYANAMRTEDAWCRLSAADKVLFYTDKVLAYQAATGNVYLCVRGDNLQTVREGRDRALIEIVLDDKSVVKRVQMLPTHNRDLSRSNVAIQLKDSGFVDKFPAVAELLRYQLVWQEVDGDLRHREIFDTLDIRLDLLNRAIDDPDGVSDEDISSIVNFRNFKTSVVRRRALDALGRLYDRGRISPADFSLYAEDFLVQDIGEDFRVIERSLKNDRPFVREMMRNLFGIENASLEDLSALSLRFFAQGAAKSVYEATFTLKDGSERQAAFTLMRHDTINEEAGLPEEDINDSVSIWRRLAEASIPGIVKFGSHTWEHDYRDKELIVAGDGSKAIRERFVNNIEITCRDLVPGESLDRLLSREDVPLDQKLDAIHACRSLCADIFNASGEKTGKGYFIDNPDPQKFIVTPLEAGGFAVTLAETYSFVDYPSLEIVLKRFDRSLPELFAHPEEGAVMH